MRNTALIIALSITASLIVSPVQASRISQDIQARLSAPGKIGEVQVRLFGIRLYSAALFTEEGVPFKWHRPFALELKYARSFSRDRLKKASLSELERMEGKKPDHKTIAMKLNGCYRGVKTGDRFVAAPEGKNSIHFFLNGQKTCHLNHPDIRDRILGIWLSDKARNLRSSQRLRGLN